MLCENRFKRGFAKFHPRAHGNTCDCEHERIIKMAENSEHPVARVLLGQAQLRGTIDTQHDQATAEFSHGAAVVVSSEYGKNRMISWVQVWHHVPVA